MGTDGLLGHRELPVLWGGHGHPGPGARIMAGLRGLSKGLSQPSPGPASCNPTVPSVACTLTTAIDATIPVPCLLHLSALPSTLRGIALSPKLVSQWLKISGVGTSSSSCPPPQLQLEPGTYTLHIPPQSLSMFQGSETHRVRSSLTACLLTQCSTGYVPPPPDSCLRWQLLSCSFSVTLPFPPLFPEPSLPCRLP